MGVPTVSVPMGLMSTSKMPVNLTFAGKHAQDVELLKFAYAFEQQTKHRIEPPVTPMLKSDRIGLDASDYAGYLPNTFPKMNIFSAGRVDNTSIRINGSITPEYLDDVRLEVFVNGQVIPEDDIMMAENQWTIDADFVPYYPPKPPTGGVGAHVGKVNVVLLFRYKGFVGGKLVSL